MNEMRLLHAIGGIDDQYIEEAMQHEKAKTKNQKPLWRYASVAACAAIVFAAVLLFGRNGIVPLPDDTITPPSQANLDGNPSVQVPGNDQMMYPLILNRAEAETARSIHIDGHFWHDLTDTQLALVLPDFSLTVGATAHYSGDGSLYYVTAYEITVPDKDAAMFQEYYTKTEIQIAPGEIPACVVYEYDAKVSDVHGVPVVAGVFYGTENDGVALYIADFQLDGISYSVKLHDSDDGENGTQRLTHIVNTLIRNGATDLSILDNPLIPELRDDRLTLDEAYSDADFGAYMPAKVPVGYQFEQAHRFINQDTNALYLRWSTNLNDISWIISKPTDEDMERIVSFDEREKYDLSLYSIPFADSVPEELYAYVDCPVFPAVELSLEAIRTRAYWISDSGDTAEVRMRFAVLYDNAVVEITTKGISPEEVWGMLKNSVI